MIIRSLRTNHLTNPLGYAITAPTFTWTAESDAKKQLWARVQVARDADFSDILFDSGESGEISSLGFTPDISLSPRTRYFWRVEVMADNGDRAVSETAWFETAKMDEAWSAQWIGSPFEKSIQPLISKCVSLPAEPVCARVYATGLGLYELSLNGEKVGDEVLTPFCNDYSLWVQYQTYDVTAQLHAGENQLDVLLGDGWYKGNFGHTEIFGDHFKLLLELRAQLPDGTEVILGTNESWRCTPSPVLSSDIYDGEVYDARLQDAHPAPVAAVSVDAPEGCLMARLSPPLRKIHSMPARELLHTPAGELVIDFGQVMSGWVEFDCNLPEGATVLLEYGELIQNGNFYRDNLRTAKARFSYTSNGKPAHAHPHFTYYGFRYVRITGMEEVDISKFTAYVIHSDLADTGRIETSNPKVNQLFSNAYWGQIGNFLDIPTDCPQRDERRGWTGDAHVFSPTASFNMYTPAFFNKYLHDMLLEQRQLGGAVPHIVPDTFDLVQRKYEHRTVTDAFGSCAWGDAATGIPWTLYNFYGDKALLARHYENMKLWVNWIHEQEEKRCGGRRLWTCGFHWADWLALDNPVKVGGFGGTDPYYVASAFYYFSTDATARAAKILGHDEDYAFYSKLAQEIKAAIRAEFFTSTGRIAEPTQTAMIMALHMGLVPEAHRERIRADLKKKIQSRKWHLDTGFVGTYYICRTLSDNGMADVAYTLLLNEDYPSWLYEVNLGSTTIWERWDCMQPDGTISDTDASLNHYAHGAIVEWMYRCMGGINPVGECPGFKKTRIAIMTDARFDWAKAEYDSASGLYKTAWKRDREKVVYHVTVPFDCEADFIPESEGEWTLNGVPVSFENGSFTLTAGSYEFIRKL